MDMEIVKERSDLSNIETLLMQQLRQYFMDLRNPPPGDLYNLILEAIEAPLLEETMRYTHNNQSKAARTLGISRVTLCTKLKKYFNDRYVKSRT